MLYGVANGFLRDAVEVCFRFGIEGVGTIFGRDVGAEEAGHVVDALGGLGELGEGSRKAVFLDGRGTEGLGQAMGLVNGLFESRADALGIAGRLQFGLL